MSKEAMKLAASVLKGSQEYKRGHTTFVEAVEDIEAALAEQPAQQQEPVAKVYRHGKASNGELWHGVHWFDEGVNMPDGTLLYTAPPAQRTWVGLTDEDIDQCLRVSDGSMGRLLSTIEAKIKEKNT